MIFLYVEKNKIPVKVIEYVKQKNFDIKIKELDIVTRDILKMYGIDNFPALVNWSNKHVFEVGTKEIYKFLQDNGNKF